LKAPVPITPLPQFEADLAEHLAEQEDREAYERLNAPKTIVIKHGVMGLVAELPYNGTAKPGCGSKMVARTTRGTELGEMLTSTCPNSGCSKSVSRKEMLEYIDRSGGRDYPFTDKGQILRIATKEDLDAQAAIESDKSRLRSEVARLAQRLGVPGKIVEVEAILGGERLTVYVASEQRIESRQFNDELEKLYRTRVFVRPVGARDEARLTADYERCGQHCCCKNFLKVLKPISMRSAKQQKATLEPLKISGRCGRLMCCLRYEDSTYQDLKSNLPNRKARVGTPDGDGIVIDSQILTQLVLVRLDGPEGTQVAVPVEELTPPVNAIAPPPESYPPSQSSQRSSMPGRPQRPERSDRTDRTDRSERPAREDQPEGAQRPGRGERDEPRRDSGRRQPPIASSGPDTTDGRMSDGDSVGFGLTEQAGFGQAGSGQDGSVQAGADSDSPESTEAGVGSGGKKKKRKRRRRKGSQEGAGATGSENAAGSGSPGDTGDMGDAGDTGGADGDSDDSPSLQSPSTRPPPPVGETPAARKRRRRRRKRGPGTGEGGPPEGNAGGDNSGGDNSGSGSGDGGDGGGGDD
jgi:cell fate regulator YaaT (PSP1 superfamily)